MNEDPLAFFVGCKNACILYFALGAIIAVILGLIWLVMR
jgi:flagellar biogenesis protein FliO